MLEVGGEVATLAAEAVGVALVPWEKIAPSAAPNLMSIGEIEEARAQIQSVSAVDAIIEPA